VKVNIKKLQHLLDRYKIIAMDCNPKNDQLLRLIRRIEDLIEER